MVSSFNLFVLLTVMCCASTVAVPPKTDTQQIGQILPAILSGDQSLPPDMALPIEVLSNDVMTGAKPQPSVPAVPVTSGNNPQNQVQMQPNMMPVMPGQAKNPVNMDSGNILPLPDMTNNNQVLNEAASQGLTNPAGYVTYQPSVSVMNPPMNYNIMQWHSSMSAEMVLMNIQMACSRLQNFVLGTPVAREIMASVANMNPSADMFKTPKQCGFPVLSATLRMFLKTCNMYSSCSNPVYGPAPTPTQPMSPAMPQTVQPVNLRAKPQPVIPTPQMIYQPPQTSAPTVPPTYGPAYTPMARMISWLYTNRSSQTKPKSGQKQTTGTGGGSGGSSASDD